MRLFRRTTGLMLALFLISTIMACGGDSSDAMLYQGVIDEGSAQPIFVRFRLTIDDPAVSGSGELHEGHSAVQTGRISGSVTGRDQDGNQQIEFSFEGSSTYVFQATVHQNQIRGIYSSNRSGRERGELLATAGDDDLGTVAEVNGLHIRSTLSDNGQMSSAFIPAAQSPDIMASSAPVADPQVFSTKSSFDSGWNGMIKGGVRNYVYLRAKNFGMAPDSAKVYLYVAPAALVLLPHRWTNNGVRTSSGLDYVNLSETQPGEIAVTTEPFTFVAQQVPNDFSLIARLVSDRDPAEPVREVTTCEDYVLSLAASGIVHRTILSTPSTVPSVVKELTISNPEGRPRTFIFSLSSRGLPSGTAISMANASPDIQPPLYISRTMVTGDGFTVDKTVTLPAYHESKLSVIIERGAAALPANAELRVFQYVASGTEGMQPHKLFLLGEATIRFF